MLKHRGSNKLVVDGETFRYVVGEVGNDADGHARLALTAQYARANGTRLRVTGFVSRRIPEDESPKYRWRSLASSVTPRDAERVVRLALAHGWRPLERGGLFTIHADAAPPSRR